MSIKTSNIVQGDVGLTIRLLLRELTIGIDELPASIAYIKIKYIVTLSSPEYCQKQLKKDGIEEIYPSRFEDGAQFHRWFYWVQQEFDTNNNYEIVLDVEIIEIVAIKKQVKETIDRNQWSEYGFM